MTIDAKPIARAGLATGVLLAIPLVAMRLTREVDGSPFDFAFMGALLFGAFVVAFVVAGLLFLRSPSARGA